MSGAQSLLCEMLSCGEADLDILDRIGFGRSEEHTSELQSQR